jgi:hypothetical protein
MVVFNDFSAHVAVEEAPSLETIDVQYRPDLSAMAHKTSTVYVRNDQ